LRKEEYWEPGHTRTITDSEVPKSALSRLNLLTGTPQQIAASPVN